jgi:hypothetical protein
MRFGPYLAGIVAATALLGVAGEARATLVLPMSLRSLAERSDVVARVRVGRIRAARTPEAPFRVTELEVLEVFAGDAAEGQVLDLWQRGDGRIFVVGDPWLQGGEEGLVFLVREGSRAYLTALAQSWWRLEGGGQQRVARRDLSGLTIVTAGRPTAMPPDEAPWTLLRDLVRRACGEVAR